MLPPTPRDGGFFVYKDLFDLVIWGRPPLARGALCSRSNHDDGFRPEDLQECLGGWIAVVRHHDYCSSTESLRQIFWREVLAGSFQDLAAFQVVRGYRQERRREHFGLSGNPW